MGSGVNIHRAIEKYGIKNFKKEILFECKDEYEMAEKEAEIVNEEFLKRDDVYNIAKGGYLGGTLSLRNYTKEDLKNWGKLGAKRLKDKLDSDPKFRKNWYEKLVRTSQSPEAKAKRAAHPGSFTGRKHSKETKQKISEISRENNFQKGINNSQFNTCWINNLKENKKIKVEELNFWLDQGWIKGRKMFNLSENAKEKMRKNEGKHWITNGIESKLIFKNDLIPENWYKGRTGRTGLNKE